MSLKGRCEMSGYRFLDGNLSNVGLSVSSFESNFSLIRRDLKA